jgi:hypothetical protein
MFLIENLGFWVAIRAVVLYKKSHGIAMRHADTVFTRFRAKALFQVLKCRGDTMIKLVFRLGDVIASHDTSFNTGNSHFRAWFFHIGRD